MCRSSSLLLIAIMLVAMAPSSPRGSESQTESIRALLDHSIIGNDLGESEVRAFCLKRVPRMKPASSREEWEKTARRIRQDILDRIVFRGAEARRWRDYPAKVEWLESIPGGPSYHIRKLRYEAVPGFWIPALLYEPDRLAGKVPVFLNVNGHDSLGKAAPYKQLRCINFAKRGMIALNVEWIGMGQLKPDSHYSLNQIDLTGTSGEAVFYLAMRRGLDLLLKLPNADLKRVGMAGLSGGGWQTILLSSLDERVTLANPVAGYSSFLTRSAVQADLGDSEQTPNDLGTVADYIHLTALRAPRPTLLTFNENDDCCFRPQTGMAPLVEGARPFFSLYGAERSLQTHINKVPGTHNFEQDNREALYLFIKEHWFKDAESFPAAEIPSADELKSEQQLAVPIPANNETLHTIAMKQMELAAKRRKPVPASPTAALRIRIRKELAELTHAPKYEVIAERIGDESRGEIHSTYWKLRIGGEWTLPAIELWKDGAKSTALLLGDEGRATQQDQAFQLLESGSRVIAFDPFFFGESKIKFHADYLYVLLMAAMGERALGIQAAQVNAVSRWSISRFPSEAVSIHAEGKRTSLIALTAAALEPLYQAGVTMNGSMNSLEEVVRNDWGADHVPEMFCFGLLEKMDIAHLRAAAGL